MLLRASWAFALVLQVLRSYSPWAVGGFAILALLLLLLPCLARERLAAHEGVLVVTMREPVHHSQVVYGVGEGAPKRALEDFAPSANEEVDDRVRNWCLS